jgi:formylmethanofuran dehydrogenase subunit E
MEGTGWAAGKERGNPMTQPNEDFSRLRRGHASLRHWAAIVLVVATLMAVNIPRAISAPPDAEMYTFLERFHGHTCAGSLMGLRLGLAAKEALKGEGKVKAKCFVLSCPVDGIQVGAGTTYGNKALEVEDRNELYLILTEVKNGRQVEARLTKKAMEMGKNYRDLSGKARAHTPGSPEQLRLENEIKAVLDWFRAASDSEVVTVRTLK